MVAIATVEEFASAIQKDVDTATANLLLLDLAQGLVTERIGDQDPWPTTAKAIALAAAQRAYNNPDGARQVQLTSGPYTKGVTYDAAEAGVYLTDAEIKRLQAWLNRGQRAIGTIRVGSGYPPIGCNPRRY